MCIYSFRYKTESFYFLFFHFPVNWGIVLNGNCGLIHYQLLSRLCWCMRQDGIAGGSMWPFPLSPVFFKSQVWSTPCFRNPQSHGKQDVFPTSPVYLQLRPWSQNKQESDETGPPLALSRMRRLSDNGQMTEIPTPWHYSLVLHTRNPQC